MGKTEFGGRPSGLGGDAGDPMGNCFCSDWLGGALTWQLFDLAAPDVLPPCVRFVKDGTWAIHLGARTRSYERDMI
eukprot:3395522-Pyramimonas_sp.AAC.1